MRLLILLFLVQGMGLGFAFAGTWVPQDVFKTSTRSWSKKSRCELANTPKKCSDRAGQDIRRIKMGLVDDLTDPIFRAPKDSPVLVSCADFGDCSSKSAGACSAEPGAIEKWDELASHPDVSGPAGPWFIWCEIGVGFNQIDGVVIDPAGVTAADAADQKKIDDKIARDAARGPRETSLQQCVQDSKNPTLTPAQSKDCIQAIVRELLGDRVDPTDL